MSDKSNQEEKEKIPASRGFVPRLNFFSCEGLVTFLAIVLINCSDFIRYNIRFKWL